MILIKINTVFLFNFLRDVHLFVFLLQELSRVISFKAIFFTNNRKNFRKYVLRFYCHTSTLNEVSCRVYVQLSQVPANRKKLK